MITRLTKDEVSDLINEAKKSSVRFNAEQECIAFDGGYPELDQGYYGRYVNDKEKIIKAAGIDISRVLPEDNIENILIGNDIVRAVVTDPNLSDLHWQLKKGHVTIDISTPITSLRFSDEISNYAGVNKALTFHKDTLSNGTKVLNYYVPALRECGERPTLGTALKAASEYVTDALNDFKKEAGLTQEEKPSARAKLKM